MRAIYLDHNAATRIDTDVLKAILLTWKGPVCNADGEEPSASLTALGISRCEAPGPVRLSLGRDTTQADIEFASSGRVAAWHHIDGFDEKTRPLPSGVNQ